MKAPKKAIDLIKVHPDSEEAKKLESELKDSIVVSKNPWRASNQSYLFGFLVTALGIGITEFFPPEIISEGYGAPRLGPVLVVFGIVLAGWYKIQEMIQSIGEFIQKIRGGGGS